MSAAIELLRAAVVLILTILAGRAVASDCRVTEPGNVSFSNDALAVVLPEDKRFTFSSENPGFIDPHGALGIKVGWFRKMVGQLSITGGRIDAEAPKLRAWIADGYGDAGFQTSYVLFPTPGCWEVVGSMGEHQLKFVVEVVLVAPGPSWRQQGPDQGWRETGG